MTSSCVARPVVRTSCAVRRALSAAGALGLVGLVVLLLAGCSPGGAEDPDAVAAARCQIAVKRQMETGSSTSPVDFADVIVSSLDGQQRAVEGTASRGREPALRFMCVTVPDPSDEVRGLRVVRLEVVAASS